MLPKVQSNLKAYLITGITGRLIVNSLPL